MGEPGANLRVNGGRLWDSLADMATIGPGSKGGSRRLTLTDVDRQARERFANWSEEAGCTVSVDTMGNMFARREGTDPSLPPVLVGSHLDTQPTGGRYDGVLGVLAGLEIVRTLNDLGLRTRHPIEVVNWTNEEGSRFTPGMTGSGVFAGAYSKDAAYAIRDADGKLFGEELKRIGFAGREPAGKSAKAYYELHIEQGPVLEAENIDVGIVTHAQGQRWYEVTLTGFEAHAGSTPMSRRKDALLGAARVVEKVNEIALFHLPYGVGTVGVLNVHPASRNVIPGSVFLTIDFRHPEEVALKDIDRRIRSGVAEIAEWTGLESEVKQIFSYEPVSFDRQCVGRLRSAAERLGYRHRDMVSGAGHDACYVARVAPSAMVFCPCVDGISHNEAEAITPEWATAGTDVLLHAILETAEIVE